MNYLVTGATGFIGKFLLERLLARPDAQVYALVRDGSREKFQTQCERYGDAGQRIHVLAGDITTPGLMAAADRETIAGRIDHVFHLAAVYDMYMDDAAADRVNNEGTQNVVTFVNSLGGQPTLHHVSSIAIAGPDFVGTFREDMFDEGQSLDHPYYRSKFQSEKIVREESRVPYRVYRPGIVVGDSQTGEMDKIDGPYYFFKAIQALSQAMPKWLPLLGVAGGRIPVVPVDYIADAMDAIAHKAGQDGKAFFLVPTQAPTLGEVLQALMQAAHGPEFIRQFELPYTSELLRSVKKKLGKAISQDMQRRISQAIGIPVSALGQALNQTVYDDRQTRTALLGSGIHCPNLKDYADKLWSYWENYLDLETDIPPARRRALAGKVVMVTGATSGIGFLTARKLAAAGARVILIARTREKLEETQDIIQKAGGEAFIYPCDLSDLDAIDAMADAVLRDFGYVDVLVNNAGRSIRRGVLESLDRFHDFERTMRLNYFGAVRLINKLLPSMAARNGGQIVNISSIGVLSNMPRFSAYVASKAALDAFSRCLSAEVKAQNIDITAIYMPLVRTPMIAPTKLYNYIPTWSADRAAETVVGAIVNRPKSIATPFGKIASISYSLWPRVNDYVLSKGYQLFPSSAAAKGQKVEQQKPTMEGVVFANVFKGGHW
ncbi:MAG: family oxidoreductase [Moraxellaceae bacterium]|jgi:NAD(P)-dependent dehydrogenase (short-subunit alcohol dehydrogenase family)|nr:family oxidoreductase [Moraxellaceae bacterium]